MIGILICTFAVVSTTVWLLGFYPKKNEVQNEVMGGRPLGSIEQVVMNLSRKSIMHVVRTVIFASEKPISAKNVQRVLHRLAERHPLLRMKVKQCISRGIASDWFVPMENITIKLEELPDKVWLDVMDKELFETEMNREEGPLWRVKFLPNIQHQQTDINLSHQCALIFVFNHAICDGNSMVRLINETLSNLEDELKGSKSSDKLESLPLPKSLCDIAEVESKRPFSLKLCQLFISLFPSLAGAMMGRAVRNNKNMWIEKLQNRPNTVDRTGTVPMVFTKKETKVFLNSCKAHSVSPLAAFQAATLTILADKLAISGEVGFHTTVSLRPFYIEYNQESNNYPEVASYFSVLRSKFTIPEEKYTFWNVAQCCKKDVHEDLLARIEKRMQLAALMSMVPIDAVVSGPQTITCLVTFGNLGNCSFLDRDDCSPVRVIAIYGCTSIDKGPRPLFSTHLMYFEKRFSWNLTYSTGIISKEAASKVAENIKQKIINEI